MSDTTKKMAETEETVEPVDPDDAQGTYPWRVRADGSDITPGGELDAAGWILLEGDFLGLLAISVADGLTRDLGAVHMLAGAVDALRPAGTDGDLCRAIVASLSVGEMILSTPAADAALVRWFGGVIREHAERLLASVEALERAVQTAGWSA